MLDINDFMAFIEKMGADFYTGVPDSLLRPFCDYVMTKHGIGDKHIVAANEGAAVGLAAGHFLATGKPAVVYMQNSGIGNAVNPICSLLHPKVYAIPTIFVIGWRGEPGVKDEPQHIFQGEIMLPFLDCLNIPYLVVSKETDVKELKEASEKFQKHIENGQSVAFVIKNGALQNEQKMKYESNAEMSREEICKLVLDNSQDSDIFVCTTGKLSREVFEIREQNGQGHGRDFLTVGSMGHSIMIALGIALAKPKKRVFCLDGDGAALMHLGSLAVAGAQKAENLVHVIVNNGAHETVGGMPTVCTDIKLSKVALEFGYSHSFYAETKEELLLVLSKMKSLSGQIFIEVKSNLVSRSDLGRPTTTPVENKNELMKFLAREN